MSAIGVFLPAVAYRCRCVYRTLTILPKPPPSLTCSQNRVPLQNTRHDMAPPRACKPLLLLLAACLCLSLSSSSMLASAAAKMPPRSVGPKAQTRPPAPAERQFTTLNDSGLPPPAVSSPTRTYTGTVAAIMEGDTTYTLTLGGWAAAHAHVVHPSAMPGSPWGKGIEKVPCGRVAGVLEYGAANSNVVAFTRVQIDNPVLLMLARR